MAAPLLRKLCFFPTLLLLCSSLLPPLSFFLSLPPPLSTCLVFCFAPSLSSSLICQRFVPRNQRSGSCCSAFFLPTHCNWAIGKAFDARQCRKLNEKPTSFHVVSVSFAQTRLDVESLQSCSWHKSNLFFHFASRQRQQRKVACRRCGGG